MSEASRRGGEGREGKEGGARTDQVSPREEERGE